MTRWIRDARTPAWFIVALVVLAGVGLKASVDLFLILDPTSLSLVSEPDRASNDRT